MSAAGLPGAERIAQLIGLGLALLCADVSAQNAATLDDDARLQQLANGVW